MNIKKGDQVKIISGKDRNKFGSILHVFPENNKVTVEGLNLFKKRSKPKKQGQKGEMVLVPRPLSVSKVMLVCKSCKKTIRAGYRFDGAQKVRFCRKCQAIN